MENRNKSKCTTMISYEDTLDELHDDAPYKAKVKLKAGI